MYRICALAVLLVPFSLAAADPCSQTADPPGAASPGTRPAQDCDHLERLTRPPFEGKLVDVPAAPGLRVEQLVVDEAQSEIDLSRAQFWPTFVRIMSGTALTAITMMTTRYTIPSALAIRPFVYSRM